MVRNHLDLGSLFPPICPVCRDPVPNHQLRDGGLCFRCRRELVTAPAGLGPPPTGVDWVVSAFRHEGTARRALNAFKFERRTALVDPLTSVLAARLSSSPVRGWLLPVPSSLLGSRFRGFDPASSIASALALAFPTSTVRSDLLGRSGMGRQRGRSRRTRIEGADRFTVRGELTGPVVLVDDVLTTGATLAACARIVRLAGGTPVGAVTLTRRP